MQDTAGYTGYRQYSDKKMEKILGISKVGRCVYKKCQRRQDKSSQKAALE